MIIALLCVLLVSSSLHIYTREDYIQMINHPKDLPYQYIIYEDEILSKTPGPFKNVAIPSTLLTSNKTSSEWSIVTIDDSLPKRLNTFLAEEFQPFINTSRGVACRAGYNCSDSYNLCAPGTYSMHASGICSPCEPGFFNDLGGQLLCSPCKKMPFD